MNRLITLCLVLLPFAGSAQHRKDTLNAERKRIESMEAAYMTRELDLTPEEAQQFWPVFNKYRGEVKAVHKNQSISDPLDKQQKVLDLRKKYRNDFNRILTKERGMKVFSTEEQFRSMVKGAMKMKEQRMQKPMNQRQMPPRRLNELQQKRFRPAQR
jgi:hypothetical protein